MELLYSIVVLLGVVFLFVTWRVLNWVWFRPKKLEKLLRKQGLNGNSYRFLFGDMKDMNSMLKLSCSKPINLSDEIISRVVPHFQETVKKYGTFSFSLRSSTERASFIFLLLLFIIMQKFTCYSGHSSRFGSKVEEIKAFFYGVNCLSPRELGTVNLTFLFPSRLQRLMLFLMLYEFCFH